jgi:hypothetical protein
LSQFVYHFKPQGMIGDFLVPLNNMQETHPDVYAEQMKKYKGSEQMLKQKIPMLNCLWNDVLHLSSINPQIIINTWREKELYEQAKLPKEIEVYKIPIDLLDEETTICFQSLNYDFYEYTPELEKYSKFNKATFQEQTIVEPKQLEVWKNDTKAKRVMLWYSNTMHVLAKQQIDTRSCELIICR